jgi:acetylornithine deacetylase
VAWTGGRFRPGETPADARVAKLVTEAAGAELGREPRPVGVTYGADMRLFCERGIPCVMFGTPGLERAHAVDEFVEVDDLVRVARTLVRVIARW